MSAEHMAESDDVIVARYLRKASRSPKRHPATRAAMLRVADRLQPGLSGTRCAGCGMGLHLLHGLWSCKTTDCPGNLAHLVPPGASS